MKKMLLSLLAAVLAGCGENAQHSSASSDPLSSARAAIIHRNFADAADYARQALDDDPSSPDAYFELARADALRGNGGSAEDALGKALDNGLGDAAQKLRDPAFDTIRNDAAFAQLQERASPRTAQQSKPSVEQEPSVEITDGEVRAGDVVINSDF